MNKKHKQKTKLKILLISLILVLFIINYPFLDKLVKNFIEDYEIGLASRIVDGDTIKTENKTIRLLGINSPERNEPYYIEAKNFLEELILNKTIRLEKGKEDTDKYKRKLRYVYLNDKNINLLFVREGLANYYFPKGKDKYYREFKNAWQECINKNINLCEKSINPCVKCLELKEFNYKAQEIILRNNCNFNCDLTGWSIKDEGRKKFIFSKVNLNARKELIIKVGDKNDKNANEILYWPNEEYVWTSTGDTLFLRDDKGKLILWESY